MSTLRSLAAALAAIIALEAAAFAQPSSAPAPAAPAPADPVHTEAREHFERGIVLFEEEAWPAALAEFLKSRELFATRAATKNAAICLRKLQRYDEALAMFESLLREYPNLPPDDRALAEKEIKSLTALVGAIDIASSEEGAVIVIDGTNRGVFPGGAHQRVPAGSHVVRVYKEGLEPFEARVDVAGSQTTRVEAKLHTLTQAGRLKVTEAAGKALDVVVDDVVVGKTPFNGVLAVGDHMVLLRGEGTIGTQPATAVVKLGQVTALSLAAEELASTMRIQPTPAGASVAIDSVVVGHGVWEGRLRAGDHRIEVASEGFIPASRSIALARGEKQVLPVELARDPSSPIWRAPSRFTFELDAGFAIAPSFGGDVSTGCTGSCSKRLGVGALATLRAGYELRNGFGIGLAAGYLYAAQNVEGRAATFNPVGLPTTGSVNDVLKLEGVLVGGTLSLRIGERLPALLRVGVGGLFGTLKDDRSGTFVAKTGGATYTNGPLSVSPAATYLYVDPEIRIAKRLGEHVEIGVGLEALILIGLKQPTFDSTLVVHAGNDGVGTYPAETLSGQIMVVLVPGASLRVDL